MQQPQEQKIRGFLSIFASRVFQWSLVILIILFLVGVTVFGLLHSRQLLSGRTLRSMESSIRSYGIWAPVIIIVLVILSTLIPPLPLPVPILELSAGALFGFVQGAIIIWIAQFLSSWLAFLCARVLGRRFLKRWLKNPAWNSYLGYIEKKGKRAIVMMRASMLAPFNIPSFLAGVTSLSLRDFLLATAVGILPESLLFSFVGSSLRNLHIRLWYVSVFLILLTAAGGVATLLIFVRGKKRRKNRA